MELGPNRQFRPVFALSTLAIQSIAGPKGANPQPYHLFGLAIHIIVVLAVFFLVNCLASSQNSALFATLIFALYPRHHEAVFWPAAYAHILMAVCLLFGLNSYLKWREVGKGFWRIMSALLFVLAMLSNEAAASGILLLLTYELFWRRDQLRANLKQQMLMLIRLLWPFIAIVAAYIGLLVVGRGGLSSFSASMTETTFYRVRFGLNSLKDLGGYLSYTLFLFLPLRSIDSVLVKLGMLVVTSMALGASILWGSRLTRFGAIWIFVTFLPYVLLVPFGNADRYFYLPSVGFAFMIVGSFQSAHVFFTKRLGPRGAQLALKTGLAALAAYVIFAFLSLQDRAREWYEAGEMVDQVLTQVYILHPTVDPDMTFYFLNLPKQYKQARFMGDGTRSALTAHYKQPSLRVYTGDHPDLLSAVEKFMPGMPGMGGCTFTSITITS